MKSVRVPLPGERAYEAHVGVPLSALGARLRRFGFGRRVVLTADRRVARWYAAPLAQGLRKTGFDVRTVTVPPGETSKNLDSVRRLYREFLRARLDRRSAVVVLGGGVAGDTAGFAAATYMRGVPLVQCPTTLLAMVDSSIGGKVGVDLPEGKNLVGAFWQPALVWADLSVLKTLPDREWRTGLAEIIKYGLIGDRWILSVLESRDLYSLRRDVVLTERLIARSIAIKADVVGSDERETRGHREVLNLGHTFGHAIESVSGYRGYTHGEAIAVGMCAAARLSVRLGLLPGPAADRIERLFRRWGLPVRVRRRLPRPAVLSALSRDKKNLNGRFRFVLPVRGGTVRVVDNPPKRALEEALSDSGL